jgi:hypothetical protein
MLVVQVVDVLLRDVELVEVLSTSRSAVNNHCAGEEVEAETQI